MSAPTNSRRLLLAAVLAVPAAATMPAPAKSDADQIQQVADSLAVAMASRHGGRWEALVDHDAGFVLITPRTGKGGAQ